MSNPAQPITNSGPASTLPVAVAILIVIAGLWSLDLFLAKTERESVRSEAQALDQQGEQLLKQGRAREAEDLLRRAYSMQRDNRQYHLDYVAALVAAGRLDDADANLAVLLQADPDNGPANLLAARLMKREGKIPQAESHFHRAIYGVWPDNPEAHRTSVRLELADLLAARGDQQKLLAELLPLENEAGGDAAKLKKIAQLFLASGSSQRSEIVYRKLIDLTPGDADAFAGLGRVELTQGDYHGALSAFENALQLGAGPAVEREVDLARTMTLIDPTSRSLSSADKYARSMAIVKLAYDALSSCTAGRNVPADVEQMLAGTQNLFSSRKPGPITNELAEARLALAQRLWQARLRICGASTSSAEESLRLILAKLSRS